MNENGLRPEPPEWAIAAGLPEPSEGEGFSEYATRLGLDPDPLLADLEERTLCLANGRLATSLQRAMPHVFDLHVDSLSREVLGDDRSHIERNARILWGDRFRRPMRGVSLPPA